MTGRSFSRSKVTTRSSFTLFSILSGSRLITVSIPLPTSPKAADCRIAPQ